MALPTSVQSQATHHSMATTMKGFPDLNKNDPKVLIVPDTNLFVKELDIIDCILENTKWNVMLLYTVVLELDGLKVNLKSKAGFCARAASRYLLQQLRENRLKIIPQSLEDYKTELDDSFIALKNDDRILWFACNLEKEDHDITVVVITDDILVQVRALMSNIKTVNSDEIRIVLALPKPVETNDAPTTTNSKPSSKQRRSENMATKKTGASDKQNGRTAKRRKVSYSSSSIEQGPEESGASGIGRKLRSRTKKTY